MTPLTDAPESDPAGLVVPPAVAKRVSVDEPLPDDVAVVLVVGMKSASKEQAAEITLVNVALVDPVGPVASAYAQPINCQPEEAVAVNVYVSPVIRALPAAPAVNAVPFAETELKPNVVKRVNDSVVSAFAFGTLAAAIINSVDVNKIIARTLNFFVDLLFIKSPIFFAFLYVK